MDPFLISAGIDLVEDWWSNKHNSDYDDDFLTGMDLIELYETNNSEDKSLLDQAFLHFKKCERDSSKDYLRAEAYYGQAICYAYYQNFEEAYKYLRDLQKIKRKFFQANSDLIEYLQEEGRRLLPKIQAVEAACIKYKKFMKDYAIALNEITKYEESNYEDVKSLNKSMEIFDKYKNESEDYIKAGVLYGMAVCYANNNQFDIAYENIEKINQLPRNEDFIIKVQEEAKSLYKCMKNFERSSKEEYKGLNGTVDITDATTVTEVKNNQNKIIIALAAIIIALLGFIIYTNFTSK